MLDQNQIEEYHRSGVLLMKGILQEWIEELRRGVDANLENPGEFAKVYTGDDGDGYFFGDYCNWSRIQEYRNFLFKSPCASMAGQLMESNEVRLFHEHVLVKEPCTDKPTPWHHDQPYYCVDGEQVCSIWLPLEPVPKESGLEFVSGSHLHGKMYMPIKFLSKSNYDYTPGSYEPIPDIESERNKYELLSWDMEPGDCIVFHFKTLHSGRGNPNDSLRRRAFSSRWIGDDAVFAERPGETSPPFPELSAFKQNDPLHHSIFPVCWKKQVNL